MRWSTSLLGAAFFLCAPVRAEAQDVRVVVHQRLVGQLNPEGAEHMIQAGVRARLGDPSEPLLAHAHAEAGVVNYTSPIYSNSGAYLQISPLSILVLRAEIAAMSMWPIGMSGAGYYPVQGYDADVRAQNLPPENGERALGWNVHLSATLQGAVPIGPARLMAQAQLAGEHFTLGGSPFYYSPRLDLVLARQDWTLALSSLLVLELALLPNVKLRIGAYDDMRYVVRSDYVVNQVGPVAALAIESPDPAVTEVMPFVRVGVYSDHDTRAGGWTLLLGVFASYDLGRIR